MKYVESLNHSLDKILKNNSNALLIGEDLLDPYGGAFKVSQGLSTKYKNQVITTPISEAGFVGAAIGMAMRGMYPIVEIMFGDFITLAADQIINHAAKYHWMYDSQVNVPIILRVPVGGRRGYGPTHSQSLESLFLSIPGIEIVAPSICHDPGLALESLVENNSKPVLFIEYKADYSKNLCDNKIDNFRIKKDQGNNLILSMFHDEYPDITIITYGGNVELTVEASNKAFIEQEININILVIYKLRPIDVNWINDNSCKDIIIIEEGNKIGGWGSEVAACLMEDSLSNYNSIIRVGSLDMPIPASKNLENLVIPSVDYIYDTIIDMYNKKVL